MASIRQARRAGQRGVVAVEFALVAPVIFLLLFGVLELGLFVLSDLQLAEATRHAARKVRTGQIQTASDPAAAFQDALCEKLGTLVSCNGALYRIRTFPAMTSGDLPQKLGNLTQASLDETGYRASAPKEVVFLRVFHEYSFATPLIGKLMTPGSDAGEATTALVSTQVFRNEPFGDKLP